MVLRKLFETEKSGFYIDVGAHHPVRFSNTYYFYKKGWKGINIDAMPGSMRLFNIFRRRDINLEIPIANEQSSLKYYLFNEPALNGFSKEISEERDKTTNSFQIIKTINLETFRLKEILEKYIVPSQEISFLSVDVEGLDLDVLRSNDWKVYRPKYVLVEIYDLDLDNLDKNNIYQFLKSQNYKLLAKCVYTCVFKTH